jgi:hypothetical protein
LPWSDEEFRARVAARAAELGMPVSALLEKAGVSREMFYKIPATGRRIDTIEKIGEACGWTLAEVMGLEERPTVEMMGLAFASAQRVMAGLPSSARSERLFVEALTYLYEELVELRRARIAAAAEDLKACERMLIRSLERKDLASEPGNTEPPKR